MGKVMESTLVSLDGVIGDPMVWADLDDHDIVGGDIPAAVREPKEHGHGDLVLYGPGPGGQALLDNGVLDELRLWIPPLFVGHGHWRLQPDASARLRLLGTATRANGVVVTDEPAR